MWQARKIEHFPKNLFDFKSKFPFVGQNVLAEISVENPDWAYLYPLQKILDDGFTENLELSLFLTSEMEIWPFF